MRKLLMGAAVVLSTLAGAESAAAADLIPYPDGGTYNTTTYSFTAANDGDLIAYIVGGFGAGFENELGLEVNGALSGVQGLNNHSSSAGDSLNFGFVHAGDALTFVLHNISLGQDAFSDATRNASYDGTTVSYNHIYSTAYTGDPIISGLPSSLTGTYVGFEDLPIPGADFNYDDESFVFANVASVATPGVPEPASWMLLLVGFFALGFAVRRVAGPMANASAA